jgi:4-diphosphocytidyl-2-C-methyl-D-erythritol kinase
VTRLLFRCYAKLNLTLEVLGELADGYHAITSLVQTISLADDLRIDAPASEISCVAEGLDTLPDANLVSRAAETLREAVRIHAGAELTLVKRIPVAAGLGGGSSDAAATLVGLNRLWGTRLAADRLREVAADLGADVPFFLRGGAAVMRGRGEELEWLPPLARQWFVIGVWPHDLPDKTARLYAALEPADFTDGSATNQLARHVANGGPLEEARLHNAFGRAACEAFAGLADVWRAAEAAGGRPFHLSGAGPALFALAVDRADARRLQPALEHLGLSTYVAHSVRHARAGVAA